MEEFRIPIIIISIFFGLFILPAMIIKLLVKLHLKLRFTQKGFSLFHLGFKKKKPIEELMKAVDIEKYTRYHKSREWIYLGYDISNEFDFILGVNYDNEVEYSGVAYNAPVTSYVKVVGRRPHHERVYDGYYSIMFEDHNDQIINFWCPSYRVFDISDFPSVAVVRLCIYPYFIRVLKDKEAMKKFKLYSPFGKENYISGFSSGIFSMWEYFGRNDKTNFAEVYACGEVLSCEKKKNDITKRTYYEMSIDTGSAVMVVVARRRAFWKLPKIGQYALVNGQLSGIIENHSPIVNESRC